MAKVAAGKVVRVSRVTVFAAVLAVVVALSVSVASTGTTDLAGEDPAELRSGSVGGFREGAPEHPSGSERVSSGGFGSDDDGRPPSLVGRGQDGGERVSSGSGGSVGSAADSRAPMLD